MGRKVVHGRAIKIVVHGVPRPTQGEQWSMALGRLVWKKKGRNVLLGSSGTCLTCFTVDVTFLPINQAATSRMTHQPIVYVAFDEDLSAELPPE